MRTPGCASDLLLDEILAGATAPAHVAGCAACAARLEELRHDREDFLARARPAAFADAVLALRGRRRSLGWWWLPASAILAGAAALLVLPSLHAPSSGVRVKGSPVAVELYVRSGDRTERHSPGRRYRGGDALQVVYSSAAPYWLTAIDVEEGGKVDVLYRGGPLPAASRRRLDRSFVLDDGSRPERIYLLFTDGPPDADAPVAAARRADVTRTDRLDVPAAAQASFLIVR